MTAYIKSNWFWPFATLLIGFVWMIALRQPHSLPPKWELALIFDAFVTLPMLFFLCYRRQLTGKVMLIRIVALQCLAIWLATKIVPLNDQQFLPRLVWIRYAGLAVLFIIELRLMVSLFKLVFKPDTKESQLQDLGMPLLLAKWVVLEARFWRWIFSLFKR
jgi:hypothetical protein